MRPPEVDVIDIIGTRAEKLLSENLPPVRAHVANADSRKVSWEKLLDGLGPVSWIVTSPPYYGLRTYRPDQWIREWFLGGSHTVEYTVDSQLRHSSLEDFAFDLAEVFERLIPVCSDSARLVMRFGSINDRPVDALNLVRTALRDSGWVVDTVRNAGIASAGRRQAEAFAATSQPARAEFDIWCSLA